jgi:hypothetical protein
VIVLDDTTGACTDENEVGGDLLVNNTATGTITKSGSTDPSTQVTRIDGTLDNDGLLDVHAGQLNMTSTSAVTQTGTFASTGGANSTIAFADGTFRMGAGTTVAGDSAIDGADVEILDGATLDVAAGDTLSMSSGTVGGDGPFHVAGTFDWTGGRHTGNGATVIDDGGTATFDGSGFALGLDDGRIFVNHGSIVWTAGDFWAGEGTSFVNAGTLEMQGDSFFGSLGFFGFGSGALFHNAGLLKKTGATTSTLWIPVDNDGTIEVDGGRVQLKSQLLNYSAPAKRLTAGNYVVHDTATLGLPGGMASNASSLVLDGAASKLVYVSGFPQTDLDALDVLAANLGAGDLTLDNGRAVTTPGPLRNAGVVTIGTSSTLTTTGAYRQTGGITALDSASSSLTATGAAVQVTAGQFGGIGSAGPELNASGGEIQPGLGDPGILHADAYSAGPGATLRMQIAGATPGSGYDRLAIAGAATLGGTLAIEQAPAFHPTLGSSFQILTFASRTGTFSSVTGLSPGGGLAYDVVYNATDVTLVVTSSGASSPPGDAGAVAPSADLGTTGGDAAATGADGATTDGPAAATTYDDAAFAVLSGVWMRRTAAGFFDSTYSVASKPGSTLVRAGLSAERVSLLARTCRGCGTVAVLWNKKLLRRIDLRRRGPATTRLYSVARFPGMRTGTLTLRVVSRGRPVAVDAVLSERSG